jgi:hypothetical protein
MVVGKEVSGRVRRRGLNTLGVRFLLGVGEEVESVRAGDEALEGV